ncbi:glycosyltransferase family A protein [soil metagenome]
MKPIVSVIMPAFMHGAFISQAIRSVLGQTLRDWELIIVNDGSSDDTEIIVEPYTRDQRIRYFYQDNCGPAAARNFAVSKARGELIAYLDADDLYLKNHLAVRLARLEKSRSDFVFGPVKVVKNGSSAVYHGELADTETGCVLPLMVMHKRICFGAGIFDKRDLFEEDLNLFLKIGASYRAEQFSSPVTAIYNKHTNSISTLYESGGAELVLQYMTNHKRS